MAAGQRSHPQEPSSTDTVGDLPEPDPAVPCLLTSTRQPGSTVQQAVYGHFRQPGVQDVLLGKQTSLQLLEGRGSRELVSIWEQPVVGRIIDLGVLPYSADYRSRHLLPVLQGLDLAVLLTDAGKVMFVYFDVALHRFQIASEIPVFPAGLSHKEGGQMLAVDPHGRAIAVAGAGGVMAAFAVLPAVAQPVDGRGVAVEALVVVMGPAASPGDQDLHLADAHLVDLHLGEAPDHPDLDVDDMEAGQLQPGADDQAHQAERAERAEQVQPVQAQGQDEGVPDVEAQEGLPNAQGQQPQPQLQQQQQPEIDAPLGEEEEEEELPEVGAMRPPDRDATLGDIVSLAFLGGVGADQDCRLVVLSHSESTFTVHVIGWELSSRQLRRQYIFDWDADDAVLGPLGTPLHVTAIPDTLSAVAVVAQYGVVALDWAAADASVEPQAAWPTRLDLAGMPGLRDGSCYLHETPSPLRGAAERERAAADTVFGTPPGTAGSDSGGVGGDRCHQVATAGGSSMPLQRGRGRQAAIRTTNGLWLRMEPLQRPSDAAGLPTDAVSCFSWQPASCAAAAAAASARAAAGDPETCCADLWLGTASGQLRLVNMASWAASAETAPSVAAAEPAKRRQWAMRLENAVTQAHGCLACLLALPSGDVIVSVDKSNTDLLEPMGAAGLAVSPARRTFLARHAGLQRVGTLVEGGPIADFALGDPQHLGENKVYAACGRGSTGSIRILHTSRLVETLYESEADYLGVTGLWSLKACERNEAHCLVVLSFVSGSRAMAAGTTLCDVTDAVGLAETEQTLACGRVDDHVLAQVTHGCVLLCHMGRALNQESDPATFHSTRRPYFSATSLRDLDINAGSPARDPAQDAGSLPHGAMDAPCGWGDSATGQAQARSSADSMLSCSSTSRLSETSSGHGVRGPEDVWTPPDGASISTAEVTDGLVLASCSHIKGLIVLQVGATDYGDGQGATSSPGKRKRLHRHWSLTEACQHAMPAEASCVHIIPDASGAPDTKLCAVGTYAPSIELLRISHRPGQVAVQSLAILSAAQLQFSPHNEVLEELQRQQQAQRAATSAPAGADLPGRQPMDPTPSSLSWHLGAEPDSGPSSTTYASMSTHALQSPVTPAASRIPGPRSPSALTSPRLQSPGWPLSPGDQPSASPAPTMDRQQAQQALRVPAVADGDIPESVLLLPSRALDDSSSSSHRSGTHIEVLIGWRSGVLQQLQLPLPGSTPAPAAHPSHHASSAPAPAAHPSQGTSSVPVPAAHASHGASSAQQPPPSRWATARQLGGMPVFLSAMPDGYAAPCFAISDRLSLLDFAPASGLVTPTALALTDVIRAVPLVQPTEALSPEAGISSRFTLLCATQQGVLTLLDLSAQCRPSHMRTWPLQATPLKVAMLDSVPALAVLCSLAAPDGLNPQHELRCLDPVTGQQLACMSLQPREQGACLCVCSTAAAAASQNVPPGQPADSHIPGIPRPQAPREGPTAFDDIWEFPEEAPPAEGVRTESGQDGTAAAAASEAQTQVGEFLVVGTTRNMEPRVRADRETWLGRLLVLQVVGPRQPGTGPQLILVDQIKLSDPVHAVCYHRVGSEPSEPSHMRFVASVGKRLVSFELVGQRLYRGGWTPTRRVVTSLSWHPCHPGYLCAADPANSVVIYSFNAAATTEPFQAVCADAMSRPIADAVMVDRGWRALALSTLGQLVVLGPQRVYCGPERNMDTLAHFRTGEVALRMLPGDMRIQYESGSDEGQAGPSTSMEPGTPESWTIGTLQGSVREVRRLLPAQHAVLAAVERVLGRHPCTAPISGHRHAQYRSSTFVGPGVQGSWQSSQAINILDGDLLSQLPSLPQQVQQSILQGVQAEDFSSACTQEEAISLLPWAHSAAFVSALILHLLAD